MHKLPGGQPRPWRSQGTAAVTRLIAVLCLLILAVGLATSRAALAQQGAGSAAVPVPVVRPVVRELVEYDEYTGRFAAVNRVDVRARVSGYLSAAGFTEGQVVQAGDLLFVIDQRGNE